MTRGGRSYFFDSWIEARLSSKAVMSRAIERRDFLSLESSGAIDRVNAWSKAAFVAARRPAKSARGTARRRRGSRSAQGGPRRRAHGVFGKDARWLCRL